MKPLEAIRCTLPNCPCECFSPGKVHIRACDSCKHGWVAHALDKLGYRHIFNLGMQVEVVQPNIVFDIASLMLYGAQATPIRLKILLDRLFSVLQHDEVLQVLQGFGWNYEDYARGYILQDSSGHVLDKWTVATREEEHIILQQFLRFGETKSIAQEIILQDTKDQQDLFIKQSSRADSEIKKFIERSNHSMHSYMRSLESRHLFANRLPFVPVGSRLMTPPVLPNFSPPSSRDLRPPTVTASSSPVTTSPLGRLQTMQPFDYRREQGSPTISPSIPEKHLPGSSPSESPKNLSITPTSHSSSTPPFTPIKAPPESREHTPITIATPLATPMTLPVLPPQDDNCNNAIDYSTGSSSKEQQELQASVLYNERKMKHLRKSSHPVKRSWTPSSGFGCTFIGPNGKKRVLCTACNKTFCDKGALKIHYSAVHLKEMHKCTVDGCNMMFSSRRSRNRHSANPNPKLHMPQKRIKLPDGASIIDDGSNKSNRMIGSPMVGSPPTMVMHPSLGSKSQLSPMDLESSDLARSNHAFYAELNAHLAMFPTPEKKQKLDEDLDSPRDLSMTDRRDIKMESDSELDDIIDEDSAITDSPQQKTSSRRKTMVPTRCAQEEDHFVMSDDNSDDRDPDSCKDGIRDRQIKPSYTRGEDNSGCEGSANSRSQHNGMQQCSDSSGEDCREGNGENYHQERTFLSDSCGRDKDSCHPRKDFPKIASLLSGSNQAVDYSTRRQDDFDDNGSICSVISHLSDMDSNHSVSSNESQSFLSNGTENIEIPIDKDNPRKCTICSKIFQNHFGLKSHFQNVHLKLMHKCTVEGCSAAFPSKRSRNRHASNLKLHHKLLSTSDTDDSNQVYIDEGDMDDEDDLDDEDDEEMGMKEREEEEGGEEEEDNDDRKMHTRETDKGRENGKHVNGNHDSDNDEDNDTDIEEGDINENGKAYSNGMENGIEMEEISVGDNGIAVNCHVCESKFRDNLALKEHFEVNHPKEMFYCTVKGCEKIFSTRKSRNRHSQNDNLHRQHGSVKRNGIS
ncbi:zinc finger protein basonuclin-2-like [Ylistrum balloti]|uniref:zinc finger protein basonuclin-2-like n=1 Tax=Ylistrum balloti TaxID=509963 RepID=UPI0029059A0C|nr:zinc finger protein basonuclin-2-like [Ylistrum balloti]XP_060068913.1 zinc finger protein basonuclin-2-like [Ylistrum balloti]